MVPNYRSRLVAKESNDSKTTEMFAAAPPLESIKMIISIGVIRGMHSKVFNELMVDDMWRAYLYAPSRRTVYIEPSEEDYQEGNADCKGELAFSI